MKNLATWISKGTPWVWLNAGAVALCMVMVLGLLGYIFAKGAVHFWPHPVIEYQYQNQDGSVVNILGEVHDSETVTAARVRMSGVDVAEGQEFVDRHLIKVGNRDITGSDFVWIVQDSIQTNVNPMDAIVLERRDWGNFYGYLVSVSENGKVVAQGEGAWESLQAHVKRATDLHHDIRSIENGAIGKINYSVENLRLAERRLQIDGVTDAAPYDEIKAERQALNDEYQGLQGSLTELNVASQRDSAVFVTTQGVEINIPLYKIVRASKPNSLSFFGQVSFYIGKVWEFVSDEPREANTEGGIFPAIFGTVMMVFLMTLIVTPFGVVAAIYLREYAAQGFVTRLVRISVNNLAGVPSIVYGVFGLGFFVYFLGGNIDELFYPEADPAPVFGSPGLLWASLTLALLTLPVVIVATEEGLARIPRTMKEGSLALGATKAETLWQVIIPMSSPAIMTGMILAIARAAGEVAPLMLVGVVKLAPSLPLDGNAPFLHLERKFMHLGFHIYDVGFQSPNVEAARPLVFATAFLLVAVIALLNLAAIQIRNRLREKHKALES